MACGLNPIALREARPLVRLQYRTEAERYMVSVHKGATPDKTYLAVKGDPQQVLARCGHLMERHGEVVPLDEPARRQIMRINDDLAGRGLRVLGFAYAEGSAPSLDEKALVWAGAAGLKDPVVRGARELVDRLHRAGIRPIMITGDQAATAKAIAMEVDLGRDATLRVLDAADLDRLPPDVLSAVASRAHVFARVPPTKKLRIVEALQRSGATVGMTGDGFNDAPALKAANIAIAVGSGTATVARDVADVIVAESDLNVIADGIEQGRTILSNIRKSVHYMVSTNLSEIFVLLAESLKQNDVLESPMELLWLNLVTDILPGLGLALEPPERLVMSRPPRDASRSLLSAGDLRHAVLESGVIAGAVLGAHGYGLATYGPGPQTRTVTFMSLVASQLFHALACRHDRFEPLGGRALFGNPALNAALLGSAALQALPFTFPTLRRLLGISAARPADLAVAGLSGLAAFVANEAILAYRTRDSLNERT
jgi:Ca2+-transporting ATPase